MIDEAFDNPHHGHDIDPASLETVEIEIDGNLIMPQAFIVRGRRQLSRAYLGAHSSDAAIFHATTDLMTVFAAWLAIQMPVYKWRQEPEVTHQRDFFTDNIIVQLYARGHLDIPVRVADHRPWLVELP